MAKYYILEDKKPVPSTLVAMNKWFRNNPTEVAYTQIDEVGLRTSFIGISQSFGIEDPKVFATKLEGSEIHFPTRFWSTWERAEKGHLRAVEDVRQMLKQLDRSANTSTK